MDALDTSTLVDIFRAEENACLLGTDAVRDGVDVPGRALRLVVFDRVRENLRKYKKMDLAELVDLSVNQTLSRTVMTSGTSSGASPRKLSSVWHWSSNSVMGWTLMVMMS